MESKSLGTTTILLDDDAELINLYVDLMKFPGFEHIITANNGEDVITKYETYRPDLVLMNVICQKWMAKNNNNTWWWSEQEASWVTSEANQMF